MSKIIKIESDDAFSTHLSSIPPTTLLIISFYATWAEPCKQMELVLNTLAQSYPATTPPTTSWISINAEELPDISEKFGVTAVPFLVLMRDNQRLETVSGSDAAKVRATVERHTKSAADLPSTENPVGVHIHQLENADAPRKSDASKDSDELNNSKEDLTRRLEQLVKAAPVMLFMKGTPDSPQCGFSRKLVGLLRERSVRYGFFNILADDDVRQGLKVYADWPTYPQLWIDGELIGGLDIVKEELDSNPTFLEEYAVKSSVAPSAQTA